MGKVRPVGDDVLRDDCQGWGRPEVEGGDFLGEGKTKDKRKEASGGLSLRALTQIESKYQEIRQTSQHTERASSALHFELERNMCDVRLLRLTRPVWT